MGEKKSMDSEVSTLKKVLLVTDVTHPITVATAHSQVRPKGQKVNCCDSELDSDNSDGFKAEKISLLNFNGYLFSLVIYRMVKQIF